MNEGKDYLNYALLVLIGLTSSVSEILLYRWVKSATPLWLLFAGGLWLSSLMLLGLLFKAEHFSFGAVVVLATLVHLVIGIGWGLLFSGYKLSSLELTGLLFAALAVVLLEVGRAKP